MLFRSTNSTQSSLPKSVLPALTASSQKPLSLRYSFAREERLAQQQWIEQMYEKNNSYNSPAAQMQRMKEAGLNPDLMYSRGDVGNATAPEAPAQAPTPRFNVILTNTYGQTAQIAADAGLKAAQARLASSESKKADTEGSLLTADYP